MPGSPNTSTTMDLLKATSDSNDDGDHDDNGAGEFTVESSFSTTISGGIGRSGTSIGPTMTGRHLHFPSDPLNIDFDYGRIEILLHHNALGKHWIPICG